MPPIFEIALLRLAHLPLASRQPGPPRDPHPLRPLETYVTLEVALRARGADTIRGSAIGAQTYIAS